MRTLALKPKATLKTKPVKSTQPARALPRQSRDVHSLQRTIGNYAIQRMLQDNAEELNSDSATTKSTRFTYDLSQVPIHPKAGIRIQTKLTVSTPGDIYEQEADRVADQVMRMPEDEVLPGMEMSNGTQGRPVQQMWAEREEGERNIQRKEAAGQTPTVTPAIAARLDATRGRGEPLPKSVRSFMEPRFGVDFAGIPVHTGNEAARLNHELRSQAFTRQRDIYFAAGMYRPESAAGKRLIAHELTHVIQQSGSLPQKTQIARRNAQETGAFLNKQKPNPVLFNVVQRQENTEDESSEESVVKSVIEAMSQNDPIAGASDIDKVFRILNKYSLPFLARVLSKVYDQGYFHGLLGYLAQGTKANDKVIVAIRFIQCQNEPSNLTIKEIQDAENYIKNFGGASLQNNLELMIDCFERERLRKERKRERQSSGSRQGPKTLTQGTMDWWLVPKQTYSRYRGQPSARIQIMFTPKQADRNKTITFLQTVLQTTTSSGSTKSTSLLDIGKKQPFDPFYGAGFSTQEKKWVPEGAPKGYKNAPSSVGDSTAYLYDEPSVPPTQTKTFESVAVVLETGEVLGALRWGVSWHKSEAKVFGGESKDCTDAPSADFSAAVERFYATPKTVDVTKRRDIGKEHYAAILDGFITNKATLTADHKKQLDPIVEQLKNKKFSNLSAKVGGFADASETDPFGISEQRADKVKSYLIDNGVQKEKISVGGLGATWVRYPPSAKENRNRRVQILLYWV